MLVDYPKKSKVNKSFNICNLQEFQPNSDNFQEFIAIAHVVPGYLPSL
jgi:hypothetical protein